MRNFQNNQG